LNRARLWGNVWLRAGLLHPVLFVGPCVGLCLLLAALPHSDSADVGWGWLAILAAVVASLVATAVTAARRPLTAPQRVLIALLGLVASGLALVLGLCGWIVAIALACHGGSDCPFS
jgi:hypothetical protein